MFDEGDFSYLKQHDTVIDMAQILVKVLFKSEPDEVGSKPMERYSNIRTCLTNHSAHIGDFESAVTELVEKLQIAKEALYETHWAKAIRIDQDTSPSDVERQLTRVMGLVTDQIRQAKQLIDRIENFDSELLYCFLNYQTWGTTWCSMMNIPRVYFRSHNEDEWIQEAVLRLLKLDLFMRGKLDWQTRMDYDEELSSALGAEEYSRYDYTEIDYHNINARICQEIHSHFLEVIRRFRDACRIVLTEISQYREETRLNDPILTSVLSNLNAEFDVNDYRPIITGHPWSGLYVLLLRLVYDYKNQVEDSEWRETCAFQKERDFKTHLAKYLTRTRRENISIAKESEKVVGKVDILVNDAVTLELKISKTPTHAKALQQYHSQLLEVMENWRSKLGFLIMLDISDQRGPRAAIENFFSGRVVRGGEGVSADEERHPVGIVTMMIFGGRRLRPSDLAGKPGSM